MYLRYKELVCNDDKCIKSTTFYKVCKVLTSFDQGMLTSIDKVTSIFVNETKETLKEIIDKVVMNEHQDKSTK